MMYLHHFNYCYFPQCFNLFLATILISAFVVQVECLNFSYPSFHPEDGKDLYLSENSVITASLNVLDLTHMVTRRHLTNLSGRVFYKEQLRLWDTQRAMKASFNSTFVFNIYPLTSPSGEGLAFILASNTTLPDNSEGQWLGIVNATTIGISNIVAVEFDTRRSYPEDIDNNHVGVDVKSIYSIQQEPLGPHGISLASNTNITATVYFDAKSHKMDIFVGDLNKPVLTVDLELSNLLPQDVFVGFSASTGVYTQFNSIKSWHFRSWEYMERGPMKLLWLWILIPVVVVGAISGLVAFYCWKRKRGKEQKTDEDLQIEMEIESSSNAPHKFLLKELLSATRNFDSSNKLGKGGFGTVYKGTIGGKDIAVKRICKDSRQGKKDFIAEITTIGNLNHKNLVKLIGWSYEKSELLLVYEFMPNGSLDKFIVSDERQTSTENSTLSWERRHSVICGVARALHYLHNGCDKRILHRDIKPSNVMLDSEFNSRLGDFGLARTIHLNEQTHHSTKHIAGTPGYMAPDIFHTQRASVETDVYAFGVLMLEVVCRRKSWHQSGLNNFDNSIVDWVWELYYRESITDAVDARLNGDFDKDQAMCMLELGLACCHPNPHERPSMRTALKVLTGEAAPPFVPSEKPAFMWPAISAAQKQVPNCDTTGSAPQLAPITEFTSGR